MSGTDTVVVISGQSYPVDDPEVAEHIRCLTLHQATLRLRSFRMYRLIADASPDGIAYQVLNKGLPYVRRARRD